MSLKKSYFALPSPWAWLRARLNPEAERITVQLRDAPLTVSWSRSAARQFARRNGPLLAEMQLYFSCVVKKRVIFHEGPPQPGLELVSATERLQVTFRAVESNSCDPLEFAAHFPVRRELDSDGAQRMHPTRLYIDYAGGQWQGEFTV